MSRYKVTVHDTAPEGFGPVEFELDHCDIYQEAGFKFNNETGAIERNGQIRMRISAGVGCKFDTFATELPQEGLR